MFFFKSLNLWLVFAPLITEAPPFFREATSMPLCLRRSDFLCESIFFFNLFSCANRHTIRSPITVSVPIYIDIRPIFPRKLSKQHGHACNKTLLRQTTHFVSIREIRFFRKRYDSLEKDREIERCQHPRKLSLAILFSAIQALKISQTCGFSPV